METGNAYESQLRRLSRVLRWTLTFSSFLSPLTLPDLPIATFLSPPTFPPVAPNGSSSVPPMEGVVPLETGVAALPSAIELAKDFVRFFSAGARIVCVALFLLSTSFFLDLLWNRLVRRLEIGGESGLTSSSESEDSMGRGGSLDCIGRREEEDLLPLLPSIALIVSFVKHR